MELVYLWVEDYKNIKKQGFNFSPRFHCDYDEDKNELTIDENDDYIPDFFGENINVTAIVGKNGSGKSSVLEYLFDSPKLIVTFENNEFYVSNNISLVNYTSYSSASLTKKIDFLFNPSLDYYFRNLETFDNNSVQKEKTNFIKSGLSNNFYDDDIGCTLEFMRSEEVKNFILFTHKKKLLIPHNILFIFENYSDFEIDTNHPLFKTDSIKQMLFLDSLLIEGFYLIEKVISHKHKDLLKGYNQLVKYYLLKNCKVTSPKELFHNFRNFIDNKIIKNVFDNILDFYNLFINFDEKYKKVNSYKGIHTFDDRVYSIPLSDMTFIYDVIYAYSKLIPSTYGDLFHLKFDWDGIPSSGEFIWLNIFFKIYHELEKDVNIKYFIIDEGESFLHPNWQKKYISYIIQFLKDNFPNRKIHIILTSHSPFLLSDIPKQNIIFLDKDEKGNCKVVDGLKEKKQTFGANIHTLLSDSFFMEDGLMGEFAKGKIDKAIELLNQKYLNEEDLKYCEQIISIIGEPIVKNQLQRMLDSKRLKKVDEIDAIKKSMIEMQKRLDELDR